MALFRRYRRHLLVVCGVFLVLGLSIHPGMAQESVAASASFGVSGEWRPLEILLARDSQNPSSGKVADNLGFALSHLGLPVRRLEVRELAGLTPERLTADALILAAESAAQWVYAPDILPWVKNGGILFVAVRTWNRDLMSPLGIESPDPEAHPEYLDGRGMVASEAVFRDLLPSIPLSSFGCSGLLASFSSEWSVGLAFRSPATMPLLLERSLGKGRVVFWNGDCLHLKTMRGLFVLSLMRQLPIAAYPVQNALLFQIDDSPPPAFNIATEPVVRWFGLTDVEFYRRKWYPEVQTYLGDHGIKPSHYFCLRYDNRVAPPFPATPDRDPFFSEILQDIRKRGQDVGFHGYNHQSLSLEGLATGSRRWPSIRQMELALQTGREWWEKAGLPESMSYVAPNNLIDLEGKKALSKEFPRLRAILALYSGGKDDYSTAGIDEPDRTAQEIGYDPELPQFLTIPRFSSGFLPTEVNRFTILDGVLFHGLINHFVHPDDLYDPDRRQGKSWEQFLAAFHALLNYFDRVLPSARRYSTREFLPVLKTWLKGKPSYRRADGASPARAWKIDPDGRDQWLVFRRGAGQSLALEGAATVSAELEAGRCWMVTATGPFTISAP